jgi:hypothetical protein
MAELSQIAYAREIILRSGAGQKETTVSKLHNFVPRGDQIG